MARIAGINIPSNKRVEIALTYIHGIGLSSSKKICDLANITDQTRVNNLTEDELSKIRDIIDKDYLVEGDLRRKISLDVKRYLDLGCLRGLRHRKNLPVRGQRTHTNARTRKDDTSSVLIERLKVYNRETKPVLEYYSNQNILNVIDGMGKIEEVSSKIYMIIKRDFKVD